MSLEEQFEHLDRQVVMKWAHRMQGPLYKFYRTIQTAPDEIMQRALIGLWNWGRYGYQSVEMPQTYLAALMATDPNPELFANQALPWPAFEIQIPPGLISSSHGEIFGVIITEVPSEVTLAGEIARAKYFIAYYDSISTGGQTYESLTELAAQNTVLAPHMYMPDELAAIYNTELEDRVWSMLIRLVANTILVINTARIDKPTSFSKLAARPLKHGLPRANTHKLGTTLTMDCRQSIREFVAGTRRNEPTISSLVRGHWRNQAYGPKWSMHRNSWIQPFYRGAGPLTPHVTKIKPLTENPATTK